MVIVAGRITVEPQQRESYFAGCVSVVERARVAAGCLDFAITADPSVQEHLGYSRARVDVGCGGCAGSMPS